MRQQKYGFLTLVFTLITVWLQAQSIENLKGKVVDENLTPVAGASVHLLNTNKTTLANAAGEFTLGSAGDRKNVIQITAIGFATTTKELTPASLSAPTTIVLHRNNTQLDQVVVSAQKREEVLQRLPASITAITSRQVQEYRLWDIKELTGIVPSLYSSDPGDKRNVTSVRGIVSTSYDPAVATYVDGVNQFNLDTYISPLFDVERIEVLRGPQGTLYGRNAMGGVINIITRQPTNQTSGFAELSFGNFSQKRFAAGFKMPVIKDKLFLGFAGLYNGSDGFYANQYNHTKYDKQHSIGGNYYLKYFPGKSWDLTVNFKHNNNRNNGPFPLVVGTEQAFAEPFVLNQNATTKMIDNTLNASLSVNHMSSALNFMSQTAYQSNYRYYTNPIDADFSPIDGITLINNYGKDWNLVKAFTQEFRFTNGAASLSPLQWTAGAWFFFQNSPVKQTTHFGNDAVLVGAPDINFSLIN
ncbi:MAG TPA: TonB-dependent receptor plug domain-containing protein, partial [Flavisolibacter sp.]|nr:TonB-dependent receptor plug domain-containing protein [Flavisolibacter sp.]